MTKEKDNKAAKASKATPAKFDPANIEIVDTVTMPQLKLVNNEPVHIAIRGSFTEGKVLKGADKKEITVDLLKVENLETGEEMEMLCPAGMKTTIENKYNTDFDGRWFKIVKVKEEGKRAVQLKIQEIKASA